MPEKLLNNAVEILLRLPVLRSIPLARLQTKDKRRKKCKKMYYSAY